MASILGLAAVVTPALAGDARPCDAGTGGSAFETKCGLCHTMDATGRHGQGPNLFGLRGRKAGAVDGFRFSPAMSGAGFVWNEETLIRFLGDPQHAVPGNVMPFAGLRSEEDRKAIGCFLLSRPKE